MNENLYPKRHKVRWRWDGEDGENITFQHPGTGSINVLNSIGALVFSLSDGDHTIKDIVDEIMEEFNAPSRELVASDVSNFVNFMLESKIVMLLEN